MRKSKFSESQIIGIVKDAGAAAVPHRRQLRPREARCECAFAAGGRSSCVRAVTSARSIRY